MTITTLPPAPQISDDTPTFNTKAFAFDAALATLVSEINAAIALNNITAAANVHASAAKGTPVGADEIPLLDSAGGFALVKGTLSSMPVSTAQAIADAAVLSSANAHSDALVLGLWDDRGS